MTPDRLEPTSDSSATGPATGASAPTSRGASRLHAAPGSEMGALVLAHDWAATPLGPVEGWPQELVAAVDICLSSRFPMLVCWGPDLLMVYNDGYLSLLGRDKHRSALGRPVREVWPEVWGEIEPMFAGVLAGGPATWTQDGLLVVDRSGKLEEAYFTWTYGPVHGADGEVAGILNVAVETTARVLGERRAQAAARLDAALDEATDVEAVRAAVQSSLGADTDDHRSVQFVLAGDPGAGDGADAAGPADEKSDRTDDRGTVHRVAVVEQGCDEPSAWLVLRTNPLRPWDAALESHVGLCAAQVASALAGLRRSREHERDAAWQRAMVTSLGEPLIMTDRDGLVLALNPAFTAAYGWSLDDGPLVPPYPWRLDPADDPAGDEAFTSRRARLRDGLPVLETFRVRRRDGGISWVELTASTVPESGDHQAFFVGVVRDITREREARARRERATSLTAELATATDLGQVVAAAVAGFSTLFDGASAIRVTAGNDDLVFTPDGVASPKRLPARLRDLLSENPSATVRSALHVGDLDRPRSGLLFAPEGASSVCRVWVQLRAERLVSAEEAIVGDLLAQSLGLAVDRLVAHADHRTKEQQLRQAIESHRTIGHAVGVLMERHRVTAVQGFELLRKASLDRNIKLREIAARVVESGEEPMDS